MRRIRVVTAAGLLTLAIVGAARSSPGAAAGPSAAAEGYAAPSSVEDQLSRKPVNDMTLDEIDALQTAILDDPENDRHACWIGKYRLSRSIIRDLRKTLNLPGDTLFSAEIQDRFFMMLLQRRGYDRYMAGQISADDFAYSVAHEWTSLPQPGSDKTVYGYPVGMEGREMAAMIATLKPQAAQP